MPCKLERVGSKFVFPQPAYPNAPGTDNDVLTDNHDENDVASER